MPEYNAVNTLNGTQLHSTRSELDGKSLHRTHNRGTEQEYQENYYYVPETKLVLHPKILISIQTECAEKNMATTWSIYTAEITRP